MTIIIRNSYINRGVEVWKNVDILPKLKFRPFNKNKHNCSLLFIVKPLTLG